MTNAATNERSAKRNAVQTGSQSDLTLIKTIQSDNGHLTLEVGNPFFAAVSGGIEVAADREDFSVMLANSAGNADRESRYLDLFEIQQVRGIVLSAVGALESRIRRLRSRGIPTVVLDRIIAPEVASSAFIDDASGGHIGASPLLDVGARHLAFVGGPLSVETMALRLKGAREALEGRSEARLEVVEVAGRTIVEGRRIGELLGSREARERPNGIFAANDLLAIGVMHGLISRGVHVPEDVAIVGYDDIEFAADAIVPLSSVHRPAEQFGKAAIELLMTNIRNPDSAPRSVIFQPHLVARQSTLGHRPAF
ncbi:substrate-binding domain-containing protein [Pseudarthrobacter sp. 1C304]|uniref:substrate-binding domain-containing protein n=1 Tax=Pseudarthrobacter sp. 1C304 TaxID=3457438 RepID=UPI003FD21CF3